MEEQEISIIIVEDDTTNRESLAKVFKREKFRVLTASGGKEALDILRKEPVNLILTDLMMDEMDGLALLKAAKTIVPEVEVVLMTAYGTIEKAVEAMKEGAYDFIAKPFKRINIIKVVRKALEKQLLLLENKILRAEVAQNRTRQSIIGVSPAMNRTMEMVNQAAPSAATVLIHGESGTGKELIARAIHQNSPRFNKAFIAFNCAAFPETLIESELFGHEKGAFTGAVGRKEGRFELANMGTLFLDEVGEMTLPVQVKLLRVLQEGEFERLGGVHTLRVDVRLVVATNKNLLEEVRAGRFREDLYYRMNVINIEIPPLRERKEDIPLLVQHFLRVFSEKNNRPLLTLSRDAMEVLGECGWPGNVRELENTVERAVVMTKGETIKPEDLPVELSRQSHFGRYVTIPIGTPLSEIEYHVIRETLRRTKGDKKMAAQLLGIATRTIYRKLDAAQTKE